MSAIQIKTFTYNGWKNAVEISNLEIKLIVIPEMGRIIYFGFLTGENLFYENEALEGVEFKVGEYFVENNLKQAPNVGGNRVLPCSEAYHHLITGSRHIPDPFINASCYSVAFLSNGIVLESPISDLLGIQIKRTITISEDGAEVDIQQEMVKIQVAKNTVLETIPLTIWSLSKIKTPNVSFSSIAENSIFENGFTISKWPDAKNYAEENASVKNTILSLKSSEEFPQKIGLDARKWVAGYLNYTLFVEQFTFDEKDTYPDNGTSVTIFGNHLFTELECLSPERKLSIGEKITYNLSWSLQKVKNYSELKEILHTLDA
ncbi:hypothetical protein QWY81_13145 [Polaribacter undariae]|uniref:Uncharacterized protein n=1 Tax=Polaribacter sejongensis TaxID=985043 RepID=A0AAJ1QY70_9FLAO|nr:hypothetical protein [Polaribacter undariae]MDN3620406.1 hypothetical protein [Polaribacter undariae]UWD32805.1 hypothetical protein NQP51_03795 [Polaribacter undariae]